MKAPFLAIRETGKTRLVVQGGLADLPGNKQPYFSITATQYENGRNVAGGCLHEEIERAYPGRFSDVIALHLSTVDGVPMHALENGFYHLGGTHWEKPKLDVVAKHFRITEPEAWALSATIGEFGDAGFNEREAKEKLAAWVERQKPRWKSEAMACIARHGLQTFRD